MTALQAVLAVERIEEDIFRGTSPQTLLQRTFGGQVAGQALVAATRTVPAELSVHSLHGYFLRAGDVGAPIVYRVERLRDGRSFATRTVTGLQHGRAIFTVSASFHVRDHGPEHQEPAPDAPTPEELLGDAAEVGTSDEFLRLEWPEWDVLHVPSPSREPRQLVWLRHRGPLPDDPVLHACALAYASDLTLLGVARRPHEGALQMASLDHAVWYLRPARADEWLLYDQTSPSAGGGRGLTSGRIFDRAGRMVASVVQEGLMRTVRS